MRCAASMSLFLTLALAALAPASNRIKIDTVPAEYRPNTGAELIEPVSMDDFYFEVNKETGRGRVVVACAYPNAVDYRSDGDPGPQPALAQLSGLTYDSSAHAVVYSGGGKKTICALVQERNGLFGTRFSIKNTGSCVVTATVADHAQDNGWSIHRFSAIDTYFEVH